MPTDPTIAVRLRADATQAAEGFTDAAMHALGVETGLPASAWRQARDLAGDGELFQRAVQTWRGTNPAAESPAAIVRALLDARTPSTPSEATAMADIEARPGPLRWHHGPTANDPDPGGMWCYDCGGEVYAFDEGYICSGCHREEEPETP